MKHALFSWLILVSSVVVGLLLVLNFFWLRRMARKLLQAQILFYKAASLLQKAQKETPAPTVGSIGPEAKRIAMSVEGHLVEIVEVDGKGIVCFEEKASASERARILNYLKNEGFL